MKGPDNVRTAAGDSVNVPELLIVNGPPEVVWTVLLIAKFFPVRLIPPPALVSNAPLKVVVPLPANCVIAAAVMAFAVTFVALWIVKVPRRVPPPTGWLKTTLPVPAVRSRF